eukprot:GHVL01044066.1.p1 GENE.GHVL01044066.1~~GHVL01044066.1.p1  ORF type:complete len:199 (-),score=39.12 GHVL01044066.1:251-847(-)
MDLDDECEKLSNFGEELNTYEEDREGDNHDFDKLYLMSNEAELTKIELIDTSSDLVIHHNIPCDSKNEEHNNITKNEAHSNRRKNEAHSSDSLDNQFNVNKRSNELRKGGESNSTTNIDKRKSENRKSTLIDERSMALLSESMEDRVEARRHDFVKTYDFKATLDTFKRLETQKVGVTVRNVYICKKCIYIYIYMYIC